MDVCSAYGLLGSRGPAVRRDVVGTWASCHHAQTMTPWTATRVALFASILAVHFGCVSSGTRAQISQQIAASAPTREIAHPGGSTTWKALAAGRSSNLGVRQDGSLWMWGWNGQGSTDDDSLERSVRIKGNRPPLALPPTRIGTENDWASVSVGEGSLMAIKTNGTL